MMGSDVEVLILGSGESGISVAKLLASADCRLRLSTQGELRDEDRAFCHQSGIAIEEKGHTLEFAKGIHLCVPSPGIPPSNPILQYCLRNRIRIWSEPEVASHFQKAPWIAITGTNGKTTTSTLIHAIWSKQESADLCGNIGKSFARSVYENKPACPRVVEVSSFQLKFVEYFCPTVAVLLNLGVNHLDWHPNVEDYFGSKANIFKNLRRPHVVVANYEDSLLRPYVQSSRADVRWFGLNGVPRGYFIQKEWVVEDLGSGITPLLPLTEYHLLGEHNLKNLLAAVAATRAVGVDKAVIRDAIATFASLPHRLEDLGILHGLRVVNDSKSTTVDSTLAALAAVPKPIVLIAGGKAKQPSFDKLPTSLLNALHSIFLYGESRDKLRALVTASTPLYSIESFDEAVREALRLAPRPSTLLLSPMCASFDQFQSYSERGTRFKNLVKEWQHALAI